MSNVIGRKLRALRQTWYLKESVQLLKLAVPICLMNLFQFFPFIVTLIFVGQVNSSLELNAAALGSSFSNVSGYAVILGLATASDTLSPQSYGFKNFKRVGVILQRGILILSFACTPIVLLWLNTESILLLLQQLPCVVSLTKQFVYVYILSLPALVVYSMLQKYMQAQSQVWVFIVLGLISNVAMVVLSVIFIIGARLGVIGASLSMAISLSLPPILLLLYIRWRKLHKATWGGWSFESLTEWWQFVSLGIPGFLMMAFEWWAYEISTLVIGSINADQLTINTILLQLATFMFMAPFGMSVAVSIRVGNELGAGNIVAAKRSSYVAVGIQASDQLIQPQGDPIILRRMYAVYVVFTLFVIMIILLGRNLIGRIFTSNEVVIDGVGRALCVTAVLLLFDHIQCVISGVMRGSGKQKIAAVTNFFCYYVVGVPLGITLALPVGLEALGMWGGLGVASFLQATLLSVILLTTNWRKESEKAMKMAAAGGSFGSPHKEEEEEHTNSISTEDEDMDQVEVTPDLGMELVEMSHTVLNGTPHFNTNSGVQEKEKEIKKEEEMAEKREKEEEEGKEEEKEEDVEVSEMGTLLPSTPGSAVILTQKTTLYTTSSRCCQTKSSIILCRIVVLLVGVFILVVGAILAGVFRHSPPTNCGEDTVNISSCSMVDCFSTLYSYDIVTATLPISSDRTPLKELATVSPAVLISPTSSVEVYPTPTLTSLSHDRMSVTSTSIGIAMSPLPTNDYL